MIGLIITLCSSRTLKISVTVYSIPRTHDYHMNNRQNKSHTDEEKKRWTINKCAPKKKKHEHDR